MNHDPDACLGGMNCPECNEERYDDYHGCGDGPYCTHGLPSPSDPPEPLTVAGLLEQCNGLYDRIRELEAALRSTKLLVDGLKVFGKGLPSAIT